MSESKNKVNFFQFRPNPFIKTDSMVEFYEESRDEQADEAESFVTLSKSIVNKNIYESYKSFFYRYQDYNQINR